MNQETIMNIIVLILGFGIGVAGFRYNQTQRDSEKAKFGKFLGFIGALIVTLILYNMLT